MPQGRAVVELLVAVQQVIYGIFPYIHPILGQIQKFSVFVTRHYLIPVTDRYRRFPCRYVASSWCC